MLHPARSAVRQAVRAGTSAAVSGSDSGGGQARPSVRVKRVQPESCDRVSMSTTHLRGRAGGGDPPPRPQAVKAASQRTEP
nr:hypothetical protein GCM10020093_020120 [Planobispora longispora]